MFELRKKLFVKCPWNYWNWLSNQKDNIVMSLIDKFVEYGIWNQLSKLNYPYHFQYIWFNRSLFLEKKFDISKHRNAIWKIHVNKTTSVTEYFNESAFFE